MIYSIKPKKYRYSSSCTKKEKKGSKMNVNGLINKLQDTLNKLINENDLSVKTTELSNELLETLKVLENCTSCKNKKIDGIDLYTIENCLTELKKEEEEGEKKKDIIDKSINKLNIIDFELNKRILCESCKEKKIEKLADKCGNEKNTRRIYQCKLNKDYNYYTRWVPFDEFKNIEYLTKVDFGKVHKATWLNGYYSHTGKYYDEDVVLKRIYNNSSDDKIADILNEVYKIKIYYY